MSGDKGLDTISEIEDVFGQTDNIRMFFNSYDVDHIYHIFNEIKNTGKLCLNNETCIHYLSKIDPLNDLTLSNSYKETNQWRIFFAEKRCDSATKTLWSFIDRERGVAPRLGYRNMNDLLQNIFHHERSKDVEFIVEIPVYSRIENISVQKITVRKHHLLDNFQINLFLRRYDEYQRIREIDRNRLYFGMSQEQDPDFSLIEKPYRFQTELEPDDVIDATLINTSLPDLDLSNASIKVPFENMTEYFSKALFKFYPLGDFKEHLFNPELFSRSDDVFQDAVATLLSLTGYSIIVLGKKRFKQKGKKSKTYDTRRLPSGYEVGSIDLIAHQENQLLLIDCTLSTPEEKKKEKLPEVIDHLKDLQVDNALNVTSFIFTPKSSANVDNEDVRIVDGWKLEEILHLILRNKIDQAREKLFELRFDSLQVY
jgi:hypothetical protein